MNEREKNIIWEAEFDPKIKTYWYLTGIWILLITIVGIVVLPLWLIVGPFLIARYLERMRCALTDRSILLNKGILVRREKTVPLDKITDVGLVQGPILRAFGLYLLSFETAGQQMSSTATLSAAGISEAREFRNAVLKQRERELQDAPGTANADAKTEPVSSSQESTLEQILAVLKRIDSKLEKSGD